MDSVIQVKGLSRTYRSVKGVFKKKKESIQALKNISFSVERGEIFGILGPNGAGKTTLIKILTTLLAPGSGTAEVLGFNSFGDEKSIRHRINFLFGGERSLYWRLSAKDNLKYFADLYLIPRSGQPDLIKDLLRMTGLTESADAKVETFSKGMKQRLQIARSLLNDPEILFLDEPTIGLDPHGAADLRKIIKSVSAKGTTVILTTHYMAEAEELCSRIAIIDKGELIALDNIQGLRDRIRHSGKLRVPISLWNDQFSDYTDNCIRKKHKTCIDIHTEKPEELLEQLREGTGKQSWRGVQILDVTLEDVYLELTEGAVK